MVVSQEDPISWILQTDPMSPRSPYTKHCVKEGLVDFL